MLTPTQQEETVADVRHYLEVSFLHGEPLRLRTYRNIPVESAPEIGPIGPRFDGVGRFPTGSHSDPTGTLATRLAEPHTVSIPEIRRIPHQTVVDALDTLPTHLLNVLNDCVIGPNRLSTRDAGAKFRTSKTQISRYISEALYLLARTLFGPGF